jgi:ubiquinone/menaquinone biosynthesis C-methylase UbiE
LSIHPTARGFELAADVYERARPDYPRDALDFVVESLGLASGDHVVDLGAGTGKFARQLLARGLRVTAVEPVREMRAILETTVPEATAVEGTAEAIPLEDSTADGVTAAQAFHWFDRTRALPEIYRVLRPGRGVALVWNIRDQSHDLHRAYAETIRPYRTREYPEQEDTAGALRDSLLFEGVEERTFRHVQRMTADGLVERASSVSFIAQLPEDERGALLERVRALAPAGSFDFPYLTKVFTARRRSLRQNRSA